VSENEIDQPSLTHWTNCVCLWWNWNSTLQCRILHFASWCRNN